jgi:diadenosine tetraphosphate (Ap4A) HIT family hydrolase
MKDCPLCYGEDEWNRDGLLLLQDDVATAILSVTPARPGQILLFPTTHSEDPSSDSRYFGYRQRAIDLLIDKCGTDENYLFNIYTNLTENGPFENSRTMSKMALDHEFLKYVPTAYHVGENRGENSGQSLEHVHVHLFPVFAKPMPGIVTTILHHDISQE